MATGISKHEKMGVDATFAPDLSSDNIPLPDNSAVVELSYPGKAKEEAILAEHLGSFRIIDTKGKATLKTHEIPENSFVLTDNFIGLHSLLNSKRKVNLFYLDPPYGTGMDFHSRSLEHAYTDSMGQAAYLEFMRRRLIVMRECMSDEASIYVHIGHQMLAHLKIIMDEIFGEKNFRNIITRRKCSSKNFTRNQYVNLNDYILFYTKTNNYKWFQPGDAPDQEWIEKEYPKVDELGRRFKLVPIHAPGTRNGETGKEWRGKLPPLGKHWQYVPSKLDQFDSQGDIHWSKNGNPRRKVYWVSDNKLSLSDYWVNYRDAHHQSIKITGYPTEKNFEMLKMIVGASSEEGDLVVDPFCGSGTTIYAAKELNRKFIGFDASFTAAKATVKRFRHGTEAMGDYVNEPSGVVSFLTKQKSHQKYLTFLVDDSLWEDYKEEIELIGRI
jgi:adenine-specific DNA-methyltransferase